MKPEDPFKLLTKRTDPVENLMWGCAISFFLLWIIGAGLIIWTVCHFVAKIW